MKLLVLGASGPTGRHLVAQALDQGDEVTAFVRRPEALELRHERLRIAQGDTTRDTVALAEAVRGQDAVLSALGVGKTFLPNGLLLKSVLNIVAAMEAELVKRFVLMSALGVGESRKDAPIAARLMYSTLLSAIFADKEAAEAELRKSRLDWTIVYPVLLTNGPLSARYRYAEHLELFGLPTISRADVAHFMLAETVKPRFLRRGVILSY
ncbi:MAG TPA: NAD(P)H-binding protein [Burkholderiales bacterium]